MKKRELKRRPTYEYRCDERLKVKVEGCTRLVYTGLREGLEHLKIKTRFDIQCYRQCCRLGENVSDLRLEV